MTIIRIRGMLSAGEDAVLRFHPEVKELLDRIREKGWRYSFEDVVGSAKVELDLGRLEFRLKYYPPRIEEFEEKGVYEIEAEVGDQPPAVLEIESIESFKVAISTSHAWRCATVDPLTKTITHISSVLWGGIRLGEGRQPEKLSEAREVYEVARFLLENGFRFKNEYVLEAYKELVDLFEGKYRFTLTLELTVDREKLVPGWKELKNDLAKFFYERGLLMELKTEKGPAFLLKKPLP